MVKALIQIQDHNLVEKTEDFINWVKSSINDNDEPIVFWVDLFSGAGGTSSGVHFSETNSFVAACVNHDTNAINSHNENHPNTLHFIEDIRDFGVVLKLKYLCKRLREEFPDCFINLWVSLECTNFSKAKGGLPRDADSRTLAEHMFMYLEEIYFEYFYIENVREFMAWGPLDENGKPVSRTSGKDFIKWIEKVKSHDYLFDKDILNSADYGAYQSRERLFIQFPKKGLPFAWPEQTHAKKGANGSLFDIPKWKPVREVLDLQDEGQSIFDRKKALSENTEKRILAGLEKFIAKGDDKFIKKYYSGRPAGKVISVEGPAGTVKCIDGQAIVKVEPFSMQYNSGNDENRVKSLDEPVGTITTGNSHAIVIPKSFIVQRNSGDAKSKIVDIEGPARTVTQSGGNQEVVTATHLNTYYGKSVPKSIEEPAPTVTTKDRIAKVDVVFIDQQYGNSKPSSIELPLGTITGNPKFALVNTELVNEKWIMDTNFNNVGRSIDEPAKTLVASRRHPYLVNANSSTSPPIEIDNPSPSITQRTHLIINPSWFGHCTGIDEPSVTIIARQDKAPLYLMAVENGPIAWIVFEEDSETMVKIKRFMVEYGITDIKMRMLKIPELLQIQGFPKDYKLIGTQTEQKKYIGNAVEVNCAKALIKANYESISKYKNSKVA